MSEGISIPDVLAACYPGRSWDYSGGKEVPLDGLTWRGPGSKPTMNELEAAWATHQAAVAAAAQAAAAERALGLGAVIASLQDPAYDRPLDPAKVRLGMGLITKQLVDLGLVPASAAQKAALTAGIAGLAAHVNQAGGGGG